ncbi:MAG: bifunctional nuclease family protein [Flavobacteriales bacterium]|nr:bifunctional nuclease family protein [Flavobacteriales bacterium]
MKKIKLEISGLSYSQTQAGAYALVLGEVNGNRTLPIIIGGFEAQAIALELEKMKPSRPLTHDLFKTFADSFQIKVSEVIIHSLKEGVFHSKMKCKKGDEEVEIDTRTSDAIALAVRFNCNIYTYEDILSASGIVLNEDDLTESPDTNFKENPIIEDSSENISKLSVKELEKELKSALEKEDYERAAALRDKITMFKEK